MASYQDAIHWIAHNDGAGDTPASMSWAEAFDQVDGLVTVCLVADVFNKAQATVATDVLRARNFKKPRGLAANPEK